MAHNKLTNKYNYDSFVPENFEPWVNFDKSPSLGTPAQDFQLWDLEEIETRLSEVWSNNLYTVVEFGSFT